MSEAQSPQLLGKEKDTGWSLLMTSPASHGCTSWNTKVKHPTFTCNGDQTSRPTSDKNLGEKLSHQYPWSDNGGEFIGTCFQNQLWSDGVQHETSAPDTPEQNGLAERMNQTLSTLANTMLEESKLPKSFWADAMEWNKWEDTLWGTFQQVCWSHHLLEFRMPSLCPSPKGQAVRKVQSTCTERHHDLEFKSLVQSGFFAFFWKKTRLDCFGKPGDGSWTT